MIISTATKIECPIEICEKCRAGYFFNENHVCKEYKYPKISHAYYSEEFNGYIIPCRMCGEDVYRKVLNHRTICSLCKKMNAKQRIAEYKKNVK
jgi:hypothetical protein